MSVARIKEEILHLTPADRREVEAFLRALTQEEQGQTKPEDGPKMSHEEAMDYVFTEFAPVLAKLAQ